MQLPPRAETAIIIPALNEGTTISSVIARIGEALPDAMVVVVDGGSYDGTAAKAQSTNARLVFESRKGYGRAIRTGLEHFNATVFVIADADNTYDLSAISKMVELASGGKLVIGCRVKTSAESMSLSHVVGNKVLALVHRILFDQRVTDTQSGFKAFPSKVARLLKEDGMSLSSEILVAAHRLKLEITEVPTRYSSRSDGSDSKFKFWRDGIAVLLFLVRSRLSRRPTVADCSDSSLEGRRQPEEELTYGVPDFHL